MWAERLRARRDPRPAARRARHRVRLRDGRQGDARRPQGRRSADDAEARRALAAAASQQLARRLAPPEAAPHLRAALAVLVPRRRPRGGRWLPDARAHSGSARPRRRKARRRDLLFAIAAVLVGAQLIGFYGLAKLHAVSEGLLPESRRYRRAVRLLTVDRFCQVGGALALTGLAIAVTAVVRWGLAGFGSMDPPMIVRFAAGAALALALGAQAITTGFLWGLMTSRRSSALPVAAAEAIPQAPAAPASPRRSLRSAALQPIDPRRGVARVGDRLEPGRRIAGGPPRHSP